MPHALGISVFGVDWIDDRLEEDAKFRSEDYATWEELKEALEILQRTEGIFLVGTRASSIGGTQDPAQEARIDRYKDYR
jgi:hypothetical protein